MSTMRRRPHLDDRDVLVVTWVDEQDVKKPRVDRQKSASPSRSAEAPRRSRSHLPNKRRGLRKKESFSANTGAHAHCLWCLQCPARLPAPFLLPVGLLCARPAQTMLLPFRGNPQNVQARVWGGCFGHGCAAPVPGLSSPPQACAGLMVAQAHHNQQKSKVCRGRHRPKTIFMSVGSLRGGSRSVNPVAHESHTECRLCACSSSCCS